MMAPATTVVLLVTAVATVCAFRNPGLFERWLFRPDAVLRDRQYARLFTSGLIHADWWHFGFNAYSLYSFGMAVEVFHGFKTFLLIYLGSILGGSLLSLLVHRFHDYRAVGASGGVCGVIFASIFLLPGGSISLFLLPVGIPAWMYGIAFLLLSFFALRRRMGNVGHDAHLGGAIVGLVVATVLQPQLVLASPWLFALVLGLSAAILLALIFDPLDLLSRRIQQRDAPTGDDRARRYAVNRQRNAKMAAIDELLEKVARGGLKSLSPTERRRLEELSQEVGGRK